MTPLTQIILLIPVYSIAVADRCYMHVLSIKTIRGSKHNAILHIVMLSHKYSNIN